MMNMFHDPVSYEVAIRAMRRELLIGGALGIGLGVCLTVLCLALWQRFWEASYSRWIANNVYYKSRLSH